jgi:tetratricopeptide (TPR) repeat protein
MDCRHSLALALCLGATAVGCVSSGGPKLPGGITPTSTQVTTHKPTGSRQPKASTCVAYGDFREKEAMESTTSDAERPRMHDQARRAYEQALQIDSKHLPAFTGLARLYEDLDDYERAIDTYLAALKISPKDASLWFDLGMCQSRHKDWPPALVNLKTAHSLDPQNRQIAVTYGYVLARAGRFEDSVALFTKLEGHALACYKVARMAHHLNQDEASRQYLHTALAEQPDLGQAQDLLAQLEPAKSAGPVVQAAGATPANQPPLPRAANPLPKG